MLQEYLKYIFVGLCFLVGYLLALFYPWLFRKIHFSTPILIAIPIVIIVFTTLKEQRGILSLVILGVAGAISFAAICSKK
jgi:hypothetical protein